MENKVARIFRHEEPTQQDTAPYGTECKVVFEKFFDMYLQLSHDEEEPRWVHIGSYKKKTPDEIIDEDVAYILSQIK